MVTFPKLSEVAESVSVTVPILPLRATCCEVLLAPSSFTMSVADSGTVMEGSNMMRIVHDAPAARMGVQVPPAMIEKSALFVPAIVMLKIFRGTNSGLFSVAVCVAVATPIAVLIKVRVGGVRV